jgi:hypothetical protein
MFKLTVHRTAAVVVGLGVIFAGAVAGQSPAPARVTPADELLTEIRALRADLRQLLDASIRAQLLVARVQLQEQRITALSRQLTDVQVQLQNNERARAALEAQVKAFESMQSPDSSESDKKGLDFVVGPLRLQAEQMAKADEELKRQQVYLSGLLAEEQSRWSAFNAQLEELARTLTPKAPARDR